MIATNLQPFDPIQTLRKSADRKLILLILLFGTHDIQGIYTRRP